MQKHKIKHFKAEYSDRDFPKFKKLKKKEIINIRKKLLFSFELNLFKDISEYCNSINLKQKEITDFYAESEDFNLKEVFNYLSINPKKKVYLEWFFYPFEMDQVYFNDLCKYFDDMWYPSVDDMNIFDETYSWIVTVTHYGNIKYYKK